MAIQSKCPGCGETGSVPDTLKGKKVRCKSCQQVFVAGSNLRAAPSDDDVLDVTPVERPSSIRGKSSGSSAAPRPAPRRRSEEERADDEPVRRVTEKEGSGTGGVLMVVGGIVLGLVVLLGGCGGLTYWGVTSMLRRPKQAIEEAMQAQLPPANVDEALQGVRSLDSTRRQTCAVWLANAAPEEGRRAEVVRALEPLLNDTAFWVRDPALQATLRWASRENVPMLLQTVDNPDRGVRHAAMLALGRLKEEQAIEPLAKRLPDHFDRGVAGQALEQMGKVAEKEVIKYLNHSDHGTREEAQRLLRVYKTGPDVILPVMLVELQAPANDRRRAAADWLAKTPPDAGQQAKVAKALEALLHDHDDRMCEAVAKALAAWATADNVPALVKAVEHRHGEVRKAAMAGLGRLKDERGAAAVAGRMGEFFERREATRALEAMGPVAEKEVLKLLNHTDHGVREEAKRLLQAMGRGNVELDQALADLKSNDPHRKRRGTDWLAKAPRDEKRREEVVKVLEPMLRSPEPGVGEAAIAALGTWGGQESVPVLITALNELAAIPAAFTLRKTVMESLARLKDERAIAPLAARLAEPRDAHHASAALIMMGPSVEAEVVKYLQPNFPPTSRAEACRVLAAVGTKTSVPALQAIANDRIANVSASARLALKLISDRGN